MNHIFFVDQLVIILMRSRLFLDTPIELPSTTTLYYSGATGVL